MGRGGGEEGGGGGAGERTEEINGSRTSSAGTAINTLVIFVIRNQWLIITLSDRTSRSK